jgi:hypothetical protein
MDGIEKGHDLGGFVSNLTQGTPQDRARSTASPGAVDDDALAPFEARDNGPGNDANGSLFRFGIFG